jgi:uncharacterized protein
MDISGQKKVTVPREKLFRALLDPKVLKDSIPGCETVESVDASTLKLVMTTAVPGFRGPYTVFIKTEDVVPPSHLIFIAEPSMDFGTMKTVCRVDLAEDGLATNISYQIHADATGKIASVPEFLIKSTIKSALGKLFSGLQKELSTS